jgi:hypothetical protein
MTATAATRAPGIRSAPRTGWDRRALAILMPIGPLAVAVVRGILPYNTGDSNTAVAAKVAAHQGTESVVVWLTLLALLTLIPGVIALGMLARRGSPRLGTAGLVVAFAAFACLFWSDVAGADNVALAAARIGISPVRTGQLLDSLGHLTAVGLAANLFVVGHILGLILLGVALWRGRVIPPWAALAIAASQVLHFVFAVVIQVHALDGLAWGLTAVGFGVAAMALVRTQGPSATFDPEPSGH